MTHNTHIVPEIPRSRRDHENNLHRCRQAAPGLQLEIGACTADMTSRLVLQEEPTARNGSSPGPMAVIRLAPNLESLRGTAPPRTYSGPKEE